MVHVEIAIEIGLFVSERDTQMQCMPPSGLGPGSIPGQIALWSGQFLLPSTPGAVAHPSSRSFMLGYVNGFK